MMVNKEGILDQVLRFIYESPDVIDNEKDFTQAIKNRLNIEYIKNKTDYIIQLRNSEEHFNNLFQISINKILREILKSENHKSDEYFTPLEIANILHITKGNVFIWITKGYIQSKQEIKGGKVKIHSSEMNAFVEKNKKYKELWLNR